MRPIARKLISCLWTQASLSMALGGTLLENAIEAARAQGRRAVLAVVSTSTQSLRLYRHSSLVEVDSFHGRHGENRVFMAAN